MDLVFDAAIDDELRLIGQIELLREADAEGCDPDGPRVPMAPRQPPERQVPPLPFSTYAAMLRSGNGV